MTNERKTNLDDLILRNHKISIGDVYTFIKNSFIKISST